MDENLARIGVGLDIKQKMVSTLIEFKDGHEMRIPMTPEQALTMAEALIDYVTKLEKKTRGY